MISQEIQAFTFSSNEIRTITTPAGDIYFVASDVCKVLELTNVAQAISRLDSDEKSTIILNEYGRDYEKPIITEGGFYSLVLRSDKPQAKFFQKWVTSEVLPAIRKTGKYEMKALTPTEALLASVQRLVDIERDQQLTNKRLDKLEAEINNVSEEHYSLEGYFGLRKWRWNMTLPEAQEKGRKLKALSGVMNYPVNKCYSVQYGEKNAYHKVVLDKYFNEILGK